MPIAKKAILVRPANKRSQLMLDAAPLVATMWDKELHVIDCTKSAVTVFGFSSKRELTEGLMRCAPEFQPCGRRSTDVLAEATAEAFKTGRCCLEWTHLTTSGEAILFEATAVRVEYKNDHALMLYLRDMQEKKKIMARLSACDETVDAQAGIIHQKNREIQTMLDAIPVSITIWDRHCRILACSQHAVEMFGYSSKRELVARLADSVPEYQPSGELSKEVLSRSASEAFRTGSSHVEWTQLTVTGEPILLDAHAIRIKYQGDHALLLFSRDIRKEKKMLTDTKARDEMLAVQAHWYKSLLDGVPLPISVSDINMKLQFTNAPAEKLFGKNREELIGKHCSVWNCPVCNTENCSILRAKEGQRQNFFKFGGLSFKVDTEIIRDLSGETVGYLEVLHDVTEIESVARRQAEAANEAKTAFLAQMSHEMRTPLSAVIGLSELVLENGGLSKETEGYLDRIYSAGSTLLGIVNDILDISKIEACKFEIIPQEYDVPSLINDAITQNTLHIHSKPIRFSLDVQDHMPARLRGDDIRVKQILSNLLSNAFKYTDEGTVELRVDYECEGDSVWTTFRVSDTGIGIKPEDLSRLFTDYTRFDGEVNRKIGGTGLGLSVTKRLVELMDGKITAESQYGKGSVFTARIRQQFAGDVIIGSEIAEHLRNFRYTTSKRQSGSQLNRVKIPGAQILVVDDNLINLDIARGLMRPYEMSIDCVTSGQAAVDAVREGNNKYTAIFMDHMMPGMDGVEAVRLIREEIGSEYAKNVPIIALTANALTGNEEWFAGKGFNAFVSKPIDIFRLDTVIRKWIWSESKSVLPKERIGAKENAKPQDAENQGFPPSKPSPKIDGLDWKKGTALFGGSESYRQVLRSFAVHTKPLLESISQVTEDTMAQYAIIVHGVKGSARGITAAPLGGLAESLELAAKTGNFDFVLRNNPAFLQMAENLIANIETLFADTATAGTKPQKDKLGNTELIALRTACEAYDLDAMEDVMQEIERCTYTADDGLIAWLQDNIARLNYAQIIEKITQVMKGGDQCE